MQPPALPRQPSCWVMIVLVVGLACSEAFASEDGGDGPDPAKYGLRPGEKKTIILEGADHARFEPGSKTVVRTVEDWLPDGRKIIYEIEDELIEDEDRNSEVVETKKKRKKPATKKPASPKKPPTTPAPETTEPPTPTATPTTSPAPTTTPAPPATDAPTATAAPATVVTVKEPPTSKTAPTIVVPPPTTEQPSPSPTEKLKEGLIETGLKLLQPLNPLNLMIVGNRQPSEGTDEPEKPKKSPTNSKSPKAGESADSSPNVRIEGSGNKSRKLVNNSVSEHVKYPPKGIVVEDSGNEDDEVTDNSVRKEIPAKEAGVDAKGDKDGQKAAPKPKKDAVKNQEEPAEDDEPPKKSRKPRKKKKKPVEEVKPDQETSAKPHVEAKLQNSVKIDQQQQSAPGEHTRIAQVDGNGRKSDELINQHRQTNEQSTVVEPGKQTVIIEETHTTHHDEEDNAEDDDDDDDDEDEDSDYEEVEDEFEDDGDDDGDGDYDYRGGRGWRGWGGRGRRRGRWGRRGGWGWGR